MPTSETFHAGHNTLKIVNEILEKEYGPLADLGDEILESITEAFSQILPPESLSIPFESTYFIFYQIPPEKAEQFFSLSVHFYGNSITLVLYRHTLSYIFDEAYKRYTPAFEITISYDRDTTETKTRIPMDLEYEIRQALPKDQKLDLRYRELRKADLSSLALILQYLREDHYFEGSIQLDQSDVLGMDECYDRLVSI